MAASAAPSGGDAGPRPARAFKRKLKCTAGPVALDLDEPPSLGAAGAAVKAEPRAAVKAENSGQEGAPPAAVKREPGAGARSAAAGLLWRGFAWAGASDAEAEAWGAAAEAATWARARRLRLGKSVIDADHSAAAVQDLSRDDAALRFYRGEVRRLASALKEAEVAAELLRRLRSGGVQAAELAGLRPEALLPEAKRARLQELRTTGPSEAEVSTELKFKDEEMPCPECGGLGGVSWEYMVSVREGYSKAETWGSAGSADRGERCRARCKLCLAEWHFDM